jgi:CHAD domain-containing protein
LFGDKQTERLKSELRWLTGKLAAARDLDVYLKSEIQPLRTATPAKRGMRELEEVIAVRRVAAFRKATAAVASQRYRSLLLDTLQWMRTEIGQSTQGDAAIDVSKSSPWTFCPGVPRRCRRTRQGSENLIPASAISCGSRSKSCDMQAIFLGVYLMDARLGSAFPAFSFT